jgi:hypothetical protein
MASPSWIASTSVSQRCGSEARRAFAFAVTLEALTERIAALVDLPIESLDSAELTARLGWIAVPHQ